MLDELVQVPGGSEVRTPPFGDVSNDGNKVLDTYVTPGPVAHSERDSTTSSARVSPDPSHPVEPVAETHHTPSPLPELAGESMELEAERYGVNGTNATDPDFATRQSSSKIDKRNASGYDTESVAIDESQIFLPGDGEYLPEVQSAKHIAHRIITLCDSTMLGRFAVHRELITELLYAFSVLIGQRASSMEQRDAASFIRRARK